MTNDYSATVLPGSILTGRFWGILALSMVLVGCSKKADKSAPAGPQAIPVVVVPAITSDVPEYIDEIGSIASPNSVEIRSQVTGKLIASHFKEGAEVKKGDLLFQIDPRPYQAALAQAQADLMSAKVNLDLANIEWERAKSVQDARAMSQEQLDQRKNAVAVADAQMKAKEAAVETAKLNVEYCDIKAPIDGRTGKQLVDPGNIVKENDATLVLIQSLNPIYADFTINESVLSTVRDRMKEGTLQVEVSVPDSGNQGIAPTTAPATETPLGPTTEANDGATRSSGTQAAMANTATGQAATGPASGPSHSPATSQATANGPAEAPMVTRRGKLVFLDNTVQNGSGTVQLRAELPNADHFFWPGQFVRVRLILRIHHDAVLVPQIAQQVGQLGPFVYVVGKDKKTQKDVAQMNVVQMGQRQGDLLVIDKGVAPGDQVIISGQMILAPGAPVKVLPNAPGQPATSQPAGASGGK